ncbi:MAG: hypothetical protein FJ276_35075, partial [Planctomycetes bacterium]|nr:hypothetical protein [Planctomycetota bacterium]
MELRRLIPFGRVVARPGTRRMAWCGLLLCLAGLLVRVGALQGWFRPIRVVGGSMAESLYGPHLRVRCQDCGIVFRCGVECPPADNLAVCPNCGYRRNQVDPHAVTRGQRVLIDRWAHAWGGSRAWRAVAFRSPLDPDRLEVKRLVAGNAGQVEIRDGDVFIDGQIQRKSLEQLSAVRVLVHDDRFRPTRDPSLPARWLARREDSQWTTTGSGYSFKPPPGAGSRAPDWLDYQQWTCWPNAYPGNTRCTLAPILDHYAYNQSLS